MSVIKKNGKYVPIVYMGKDPLTGKEIRKWGHYWVKKSDEDKEHAEMTLGKDEVQISGTFKAPTFEVLVSQRLEMVAPAKYTSATLDMYMGCYRKHIEPMHIQRFMQMKSELSPSSQRKIFYFLKGILDSGVKWN